MTHGHQSVQSGRRIVAYIARVNLNRKVLDFDQLGGPSGTVLQTFEWVVAL